MFTGRVQDDDLLRGQDGAAGVPRTEQQRRLRDHGVPLPRHQQHRLCPTVHPAICERKCEPLERQWQ